MGEKRKDANISIIVPIYNAGEYIEQCIKSILANPEKDIEILLIDDGSTDNSPRICKNLLENDSRVVYIRQENKGVSSARNNGLKAAHGKWILFVDADDTIDSNSIEEIKKVRVQSESLVVFGSTLKDRGEEKEIIVTDTIAEKLSLAAAGIKEGNDWFDVSLSCVWGKLYPRAFLIDNDILFPEEIVMGEDLLFNCFVFSKISSILFSGVSFYHYRINPNSVTRSKNPKIAERDYQFQLNLREFAKQNQYEVLRDKGCIYSTVNGVLISFDAYFSRFEIYEYSKMRKEFKRLININIYKDALLQYQNYKSLWSWENRVLLFCFKSHFLLAAYIMKKITRLLREVKNVYHKAI